MPKVTKTAQVAAPRKPKLVTDAHLARWSAHLPWTKTALNGCRHVAYPVFEDGTRVAGQWHVARIQFINGSRAGTAEWMQPVSDLLFRRSSSSMLDADGFLLHFNISTPLVPLAGVVATAETGVIQLPCSVACAVAEFAAANQQVLGDARPLSPLRRTGYVKPASEDKTVQNMLIALQAKQHRCQCAVVLDASELNTTQQLATYVSTLREVVVPNDSTDFAPMRSRLTELAASVAWPAKLNVQLRPVRLGACVAALPPSSVDCFVLDGCSKLNAETRQVASTCLVRLARFPCVVSLTVSARNKKHDTCVADVLAMWQRLAANTGTRVRVVHAYAYSQMAFTLCVFERL